MNDDFDKKVDLHESEWSRLDKKQPILGPNGKFVLTLLPICIIFGYGTKWWFSFAREEIGGNFAMLIAIVGFGAAFLLITPAVNGVLDLIGYLARKMSRR